MCVKQRYNEVLRCCRDVVAFRSCPPDVRKHVTQQTTNATSPVCSVKTETVFLSCCDDVSSSLTCLFLTSSLRYVTPESQRGSGGKAASSPAENYHLARRRTLQVVVSALLTECGFESAEKAAVETLTEMMQSCTYEPRVRMLIPHSSASLLQSPNHNVLSLFFFFSRYI